MTGSIRPPAVAGAFYPADPMMLRDAVEELFSAATVSESEKAMAEGVMLPHAGYVYSGRLAARVVAHTAIPNSVVILAPNHTGLGARLSIMDEGSYGIPGWEIPVDTELAALLLEEMPALQRDWLAHSKEHAIEVQLPILARANANLRIVPIVLGPMTEEECVELGRAMNRVRNRFGRPMLVIASSDMSHFHNQEQAEHLDHRALKPLLDFDPEGLYKIVHGEKISMCGIHPATAMLSYCRERHALAPILEGYTTSAEHSGDPRRVVGYAGVIVPCNKEPV